MRRARATAVVLLCAACATAALAARFERAAVRHEAGRYRLDFVVDLAAPTTPVRALLTDYDHLERLSAHIVESRRLPAVAGSEPQVRIVLRACVLIFCRTVRRVMAVERRANGDILTLADPAASDFTHARELWQLQPHAGGTRLTYQAEFAPAFFVPPLIGPWLIKARLHQELEDIAARLERLAAEP